jgi:hypothetical protein
MILQIKNRMANNPEAENETVAKMLVVLLNELPWKANVK